MRGIPYLQETKMGGGGHPVSAGNLDGGIPYLQETKMGGTHICREPKWGGSHICRKPRRGGVCLISRKPRWGGGGGGGGVIPYLQET